MEHTKKYVILIIFYTGNNNFVSKINRRTLFFFKSSKDPKDTFHWAWHLKSILSLMSPKSLKLNLSLLLPYKIKRNPIQ